MKNDGKLFIFTLIVMVIIGYGIVSFANMRLNEISKHKWVAVEVWANWEKDSYGGAYRPDGYVLFYSLNQSDIINVTMHNGYAMSNRTYLVGEILNITVFYWTIDYDVGNFVLRKHSVIRTVVSGSFSTACFKILIYEGFD